MKLDDFVAQALIEINEGMIKAGSSTGRRYAVKNSGVEFNVAVTTVESAGSSVDGKVNAGVIQVLGASVDGKLDSNTKHSEASRIQFKVDFPYNTEEENERDSQSLMSNRDNGSGFGY